MSYEIGAPVNFTTDGPVELDLTDTTNSVTWKVQTTVPNGFKIGTPLTPDILSMFPSGEVSMALESLRSNGNKVFLQGDPGLSTSYTYNFPATAPVDGELIMANGSTNVFYEISAQNTITVRPNAGPTQFTSIAAAIASIPVFPAPGFPSATNTWLVSVETGQYSEPAITVPPFVYIRGASPENVIVSPAALGYSLFTLGGNNGIAFMTMTNGDPLFPLIYIHNTNGAIVRLFRTYITASVQGILCVTDGSATANTRVSFNYLNMVGDFSYSLWCQDTNTLGGFGTIAGLQNYSSNSHSDHCIIVDGLNTQVYSQSTTLYGDGTGIALDVRNGGNANFVGTYMKDWGTGIHTPIDAGSPYVVTAGILYESCTLNINIENVNTTGNNAGYTEYLKTIIPEASTFFIANQPSHVLTVSYKGANFTSIAAAIASITDNSALYRYTIWVYPGIYYEPPIVMKPYVAVVGFFQTQCIIVATDHTQPLVTGAGWAALSDVTLTGSNPSFPPNTYTPSLITYQGDPMGFHFRADNIAFNSTVNCCTIGSLNGPCIFITYDPMINMGSVVTNGYVIDDSGPSHNSILVLLDGLVWDAGPTDFATLNNLVDITSTLPAALAPNVYCIIEDIEVGNIFGPNNGNGIVLNGPVFATVESCVLGGFDIGMSVPASAEFNTLLCVGNIFTQNTTDISIQNVNAFGSVIVSATIANVSIVNGASVGVIITDLSGSLALSGTLYQGIGWNSITNISEQIQHAAVTGALYVQATVTPIGGLNVSVSGGSGYVTVNPPDGNLKYITWLPVASLALPDNSFVFIYVDQTGTVQIGLSQPNYIENIILVTVKTYLGAVIYIQETSRLVNNLASNIDQTLRSVFGPIVQSGCIAQPGSSLTSRAVQVTSGLYTLSVTNYPPMANDNITMTGLYASGTIEVPGITDIPLQYDNAGVLTAIPAGQYVKHELFLLSDLLGNVQYFLVYGQQLFSALITATVGPNPLPPPYFRSNMLPVAGIIVTSTDPEAPLPANRFIDSRPIIGFQSSGVTTTADHNSLENLLVGNAHPQYFRVDGTESMMGDVNLGTNNIFGAGGNTLNGVDITNHHARHDPGGADALAVGVPVNIGTANSLGVAASYSLSDHVHNHFQQTDPTLHAVATDLLNGFMSATDKAKLDAATNIATPSTLVMRDAGGSSQFSTVQLLSTGTSNTLTLETSPLNFGGPNHIVSIPVPTTNDTVVLNATSASLTNKTITGSTNTVEASALQTTGAAVYSNTAAPPTAGQVLTATSATTAAWQVNPIGITSISQVVGGGITLTPNPITTTGTIAITAPVSITNGGTNSIVALNGNRIMVSNTVPAIVEAAALSNGQLLIGSTGVAPVAAGITGTTNQVNVMTGAGSITLSLPQNIAPSSTPSFASETLTAVTNQLVLGTTQTITLNAPTPVASVTYLIPDAGGNDTFVMAAFGQTLTNKNITDAGSVITASNLFSTGSTNTISISGAATPTAGQILTATSGTVATWQNPATSGTVTSISAGTGITCTPNPITSTGTVALTVPVVIANGGTNSTVALNNNRIMVSSSGAIVEAAALTNGQLLIGSTGAAPVAANITGTTNQVIVSNNAGAIGLSLPQDIATISSPTFAKETLTNTTNQLVLGTGQTITLNAATPVASVTYLIPDAGGSDTFVMKAFAQSLTNKTITSNTNNVTASGLFSASGANTISISTAATPTVGQVLTAINGTSAIWQTLSGGTIAPALVATTGSLASQPWATLVTYNSTGGTTGFGSFVITYSSAPIIDGVTLALGNRILVKDQSATPTIGSPQNGVFSVVTLAAGSMELDLTTDSLTITSMSNIQVLTGTVNATTTWEVVSPNPITVGGVTGSNIGLQGVSLRYTPTSVIIGKGAGISIGTSNIDADSTTLVGSNAGFSLTTGTQNTATGANAMYWNVTGNSNTVYGSGALGFNANTSIQNFTGTQTTTFNVAIGQNSMLLHFSGTNNTAVGTSSLRGTNASILFQNPTQNQCINNSNVAVGNESMNDNYICSQNTACGQDSIKYAGSPSSNVGIGYQALYFNNVQANDTFANLVASAPAFNVAVGPFALSPNAGAAIGAMQYNTGIGYGAGQNTLATGDHNTLIGAQTNVSSGAASYRVALGAGMTNSNDSTIVAGGNNVVWMSSSLGGVASAGTASGFYNGAPQNQKANTAAGATFTTTDIFPRSLIEFIATGSTGSGTFTTPTAAQLKTAYPTMATGNSFVFTITNTSGFAVVLAGGVGVTFASNGSLATTINTGTSATWKVTCTNSATPTFQIQYVSAAPSGMTNGQILIGSTGVAPVAAGITGTASQITVTPGAGSITLSLPSTVSIGAIDLTNTTNQLVLGTTNTITINSAVPTAPRIYTIADVGGADTFAMLAATQILTNKTMTSNTNNVTATGLFSATTTVSVNGAIAPTAGQALIATSGTVAAWSNIPYYLTFSNAQTSVGAAATIIAYFPWQNSLYGNFTTFRIQMWVVPSATAGKNLTVSVLPNGGASIGSITINGGSAVGAIYTFTFTNPGADTNLQLQTSRTGGGGANPVISGVTILLS